MFATQPFPSQGGRAVALIVVLATLAVVTLGACTARASTGLTPAQCAAGQPVYNQELVASDHSSTNYGSLVVYRSGDVVCAMTKNGLPQDVARPITVAMISDTQTGYVVDSNMYKILAGPITWNLNTGCVNVMGRVDSITSAAYGSITTRICK
ncbi:hypothetical protein DSM104299_00138 [Baekduia alba]|uniref:hypothetical protein n=1 Tax=Baekduia alba TaxID=2997333 RepID=UPI002340867A|nr:hypothetical protein [Baekduia alba]WCB91467.1 hypothetical protein DSM104299_00138 [Baekduia alba]